MAIRQHLTATLRGQGEQQRAATLLLGHGRHSVEAAGDVRPCPAVLRNFGQRSARGPRPWGKREGRAEKRRALTASSLHAASVGSGVPAGSSGASPKRRGEEWREDRCRAGCRHRQASPCFDSSSEQVRPAFHIFCLPPLLSMLALATGASRSLEAAVYIMSRKDPDLGDQMPQSLRLPLSSACHRRSSATTRLDVSAPPVPTVESL